MEPKLNNVWKIIQALQQIEKQRLRQKKQQKTSSNFVGEISE